MRVIQTQMFFDRKGIRTKAWFPQRNPGIGAAWFHIERGLPSNFEASKILDNAKSFPAKDDVIMSFLDSAIQGKRAWFSISGVIGGAQFDKNPEVVNFLLNADIVVEHSPPTVEVLKSLAKASPAVVVGTYLGMGIAGGSYPLMLLTVPAGIIIIGSAVGVSQGIQKGLNKRIEKAIKNLGR